MIGPRSLKDNIVVIIKQSTVSAHLVIREVIPMLGAIKVLLVCFLNNATVSIKAEEKGIMLHSAQ